MQGPHRRTARPGLERAASLEWAFERKVTLSNSLAYSMQERIDLSSAFSTDAGPGHLRPVCCCCYHVRKRGFSEWYDECA